MSDDSELEFVDTNIFLYAYDVTAGEKHDRAAAVVASLGDRKAGAVSIQVLQEFYVNATTKIERPLDHRSAAERIRVLGRWRTHEPVLADVLGAIDLGRRYRISFWDAMIVRSAIALGCTTVWSEDLNPGQTYAGVRVADPFARDAE